MCEYFNSNNHIITDEIQTENFWQVSKFPFDLIIIFFYIQWKKSRLKSTFLPYHVKKHHSTLEMNTFKVILLLSYLASLDNKTRT